MNSLPSPTGPRAAFAKPINIYTLSEDGFNFGAYTQRAQAVYWNKETAACRAHGPGHAECLLLPNHSGPHFGNGFDGWGPTGARSWLSRKAVT